MASHNERRRTIRYAINGNLDVETVTVGQSLRLVDVGLGGFCVRSLAPLPPDVVTSYRFVTPDRKWSAIFRARTAHCTLLPPEGKTSRHHLSGMTFVDTESPAMQRELTALLDHAMNFVSFS